jgi:plasmid stability protein
VDLPPWRDDRLWADRIRADRLRADRHQSPAEAEITREIARRALASGARGVALTGSTARGQRTEFSDLDYHVVGPRFKTTDLAGEIDVYIGRPEHFWAKLRGGDDFVQWTLRFGCILEDDGVFRAGLRAIEEELIWPDAGLQFARLSAMCALAERLVAMGDRDAAAEQLRALLTSLARGLLLDAGVFPLARRELPGQLREVNQPLAAAALAQAIDARLSLTGIGDILGQVTAAWPREISAGNRRAMFGGPRRRPD